MTHPSDRDLVKPLPRRRGHDGRWLRRALVLATFIVLTDAVFGERGLSETWRARRAYADAHAALVQVQGTNARLREQARRLSRDRAAIEDVARKEHGLVRPGEILFVVRAAGRP